MRIFIVFILTLFNYNSFACSGHGKSIEQHFDSANKVFRGRVINSKPVDIVNNGLTITHEVTILTSVIFKGDVSLIEKAYVADSSSSCGISLANDEQVFYVSPDNYTGQLTGTFKLTIMQKKSGEVVGVMGEKSLIKLKQLAAEKT